MLRATHHALKEWQITVDALLRGDTLILLRKGGIQELRQGFTVQHSRVLLFPTYEHQQPQLLKPPYDRQVTAVASGSQPFTVVLNGWAEITETLLLQDTAQVSRLLPFHVGNERFVEERLQWQPQRTLAVLLLRVYRLPPVQLPYQKGYGGCRSWIELEPEIALEDHDPVLTDGEFQARVAEIRRAIAA
jgi:hypothetical protein